jgi:hypothetical protein
VLRTVGIKSGQQQQGQAELPGQTTGQGGDGLGSAARQHPGQQRDQQRPQPAGEHEHRQLREGLEDIAAGPPAGRQQQNQQRLQTHQTAQGERAGQRLNLQRPQNRAQPQAWHHTPTPAKGKGAGQA